MQHDADDELMKKAREGMTEDEVKFSVEFPLDKQALLWSDKYRPRKPRFFNRVHTVSDIIMNIFINHIIMNIIVSEIKNVIVSGLMNIFVAI